MRRVSKLFNDEAYRRFLPRYVILTAEAAAGKQRGWNGSFTLPLQLLDSFKSVKTPSASSIALPLSLPVARLSFLDFETLNTCAGTQGQENKHTTGTMAQKSDDMKAPGAVTPQKKIELFSPTYFAACTLGGIIGKSSFPRF